MTEEKYSLDELINEEWRDMVGWEGIYQISNIGRCKRIGNGSDGRCLPIRMLKPKRAGASYQYLGYRLTWNNKTTLIYVHRAVLIAFLGQPPTPKHQVNHKDGNKHNNYIDNLEWMTAKENQAHRYEVLGHSQNGENNGSNKYSEKLIQEVIKLYKSGMYSQREISRMTNIDYRYVNQIVLEKAWTHLDR